MDTAPRTTPWLIFDGDCAFCTSSATWLAERLRRPGQDPVRLVPWQFTDLAEVGATAERAVREVLWVTPAGRISGGAEAFADWLRYSGGVYAVVGAVIDAPVVRRLAGVVYRLIAVNRHRMPGGTPACALPPPGSPPRS